jgi:hypothetical protein
MQSIANVEQLKEEFKTKGIVSFPFLKVENANDYVDHLLTNVPVNDWILSTNKKIEISPKNINLIVNEWNNKDVQSKYFYLPTNYKDPKVFNLFKKSLVTKHINKILPEITTLKNEIATLMTPGCYVNGDISDKIRFVWHLEKDWKEEYGGILNYNGEIVVPKFSHITIFKTNVNHNINQVVDNLEFPHLLVTGFLE